MDNPYQARMFPTDLPASGWTEFCAAGFTRPVSGVIFRSDDPPCCGVPLGGVATGCLDIDVRGVLGLNSLFNMLYVENGFAGRRGNVFPSLLTRKRPEYPPFLGLALGEATWVLASREILKGGAIQTCVDPVFIARTETAEIPPVTGVQPASNIHYWGHYPVVDMEYELADGPAERAPLSIGLRAWAPFIPGDLDASTTPCAFFEAHLRNETDDPQKGTLAFSFPGPVPPDFQGELHYSGDSSMSPPNWPSISPPSDRTTRQPWHTAELDAIEVIDGNRGYVLGVLGQRDVRFGGELGRNGGAWAATRQGLPGFQESERGVSAGVDFVLAPRERTTVRFILAWYAPQWQGLDDKRYTAMYATRFGSAREVAEQVAPQCEFLLQRVLAWQQAIYAEAQLPLWLRDTLINNLALIPETTYWAVAKPPLGDWCYQWGFFGMLESPRGCPQIECNPCTFYGNLPIIYFFPELARSQLEGYRHYQREDGAAPFVIGAHGPPDMASPSWDWQISLNGPVYVILVDRLWRRTGDDESVAEFRIRGGVGHFEAAS